MAFSRKIENLIANLRGLPEDTSRSFLRKEKHLGDLLKSLEYKNVKQQSVYDAILSNWAALLGPEYASRCQPLRLSEGNTLIISVPNATLRQQLHFQKNALLKKLQALPLCRGMQNIVLLSH